MAVSWLAPAYGIAALLVLGGIAVRLPGHAVTAAVVLVVATVLAAGYLWRRVGGLGPAAATGAPVIAITVLAAALPFAIAGFVGILGVGLINDDMASHLIIADYIGHYSGHRAELHQGRLSDRAARGGRRGRAPDRRRPRRRLRRLHGGAGAAARAARRSACSARCRASA